MVWNVDNSIHKFDSGTNRSFTEKYIGQDSKEINILAPMNFIFNEITQFNRIQGDLGYADLLRAGLPLHGTYLLKYADSTGLDYLVITEEYRHRFGMDTLSEAQRNKSGFITVETNKEFELLKNENKQQPSNKQD